MCYLPLGSLHLREALTRTTPGKVSRENREKRQKDREREERERERERERTRERERERGEREHCPPPVVSTSQVKTRICVIQPNREALMEPPASVTLYAYTDPRRKTVSGKVPMPIDNKILLKTGQ